MHAMAVIEWEKLSVYNYVYPCYKAATQKVIYLNAIHPIENHDSAVADDNTDLVVGGEMRTLTGKYYHIRIHDHQEGQRKGGLNLEHKG